MCREDGRNKERFVWKEIVCECPISACVLQVCLNANPQIRKMTVLYRKLVLMSHS